MYNPVVRAYGHNGIGVSSTILCVEKINIMSRKITGLNLFD